ncbi:hypothetical protein EBS02_09070, partial [bacterium]|nr:hypothetical protein [bacterium]
KQPVLAKVESTPPPADDKTTLSLLTDETESVDEDNSIQAPKVKAPKVKEDGRSTRPRTQKQIEAFEKVKAIRDAKRKERIEKREQEKAEQQEAQLKLKEELQKQTEAKILKKAVAIKKKHIIQEAMLDEISDEDEIPIEVVKKIQQRKEKKTLPAKPQPIQKKESPAPKPQFPVYTFI